MRRIRRLDKLTSVILLLFVCLPIVAYAAQPSIGSISNGLLGPLDWIAGTFYKLCYACGAIFFIVAIGKWRVNRKDPNRAPFSSVLFFLIAGVALLLLPTIAYLAQHGQPMGQEAALPNANYV